MAENVLASKFGLTKPGWINGTTYDDYVLFHHEPDQVARRGGWHQG